MRENMREEIVAVSWLDEDRYHALFSRGGYGVYTASLKRAQLGDQIELGEDDLIFEGPLGRIALNVDGLPAPSQIEEPQRILRPMTAGEVALARRVASLRGFDWHWIGGSEDGEEPLLYGTGEGSVRRLRETSFPHLCHHANALRMMLLLAQGWGADVYAKILKKIGEGGEGVRGLGIAAAQVAVDLGGFTRPPTRSWRDEASGSTLVVSGGFQPYTIQVNLRAWGDSPRFFRSINGVEAGFLEGHSSLEEAKLAAEDALRRHLEATLWDLQLRTGR
jgi:hypothetical protein